MNAFTSRFAEIEPNDDGTYSVYNLVAGHYVYNDPDPDKADFPTPRVYDSFRQARTAAIEMSQHYRSLL